MTIILGLATLLLVPVVFVLYSRKFDRWEDDDFDEKYGAIFDGLRKDRYSSLFFILIFVLRRIAFALVAVLAYEYVVV